MSIAAPTESWRYDRSQWGIRWCVECDRSGKGQDREPGKARRLPGPNRPANFTKVGDSHRVPKVSKVDSTRTRSQPAGESVTASCRTLRRSDYRQYFRSFGCHV